MRPMAAVACAVELLTKAVEDQPKQPASVFSEKPLSHSTGPGSGAGADARASVADAPMQTAASSATSANSFALESFGVESRVVEFMVSSSCRVSGVNFKVEPASLSVEACGRRTVVRLEGFARRVTAHVGRKKQVPSSEFQV